MLKENDKVPTGLKGILVTKDDIKADKPGKTISLSSLYKEQPLVLFFYPKDMTPGCTTEAQGFRDFYSKIKKAGAEVVGCSRDDESRHCKFIDKNGLTFPLLSDNTAEITETFGIWAEKQLYGKKFMGIVRSTFIIHKGKILKAYPRVKVKEHAGQILADLKNLAIT